MLNPEVFDREGMFRYYSGYGLSRQSDRAPTASAPPPGIFSKHVRHAMSRLARWRYLPVGISRLRTRLREGSAFERSRWRGGRLRVVRFGRANCDDCDHSSRSTVARIRITFPIQYPISNCPAKSGLPSNGLIESAAVLTRRAPIRKHCASDKVLGQ